MKKSYNIIIKAGTILLCVAPVLLRAQYGYSKENYTILYIITGILWFILCFVVASTWKKKGLSYGKGFVISLFFSPVIGILMGIFEAMSTREERQKVSEIKAEEKNDKVEKRTEDEYTCTDCGATVTRDAKFCSQCGAKFD